MIENLTSGAKAIALAELGSTEQRNATEIVGNVAAMKAALELADRLDQHAILAMHAALLARPPSHTPSSRPSIPSPTATAAPAGRWFTRCCGVMA